MAEYSLKTIPLAREKLPSPRKAPRASRETRTAKILTMNDKSQLSVESRCGAEV